MSRESGPNEPGQPSAPTGDVDRDLPAPVSALAIGAHPDDIDFGAGGTLAKWSAAGTVVHGVVCTDGSKGTWDAAADLDALIAQREREQRAALAHLGARGRVVFLGRTDGELANDPSTRAELVRVLRSERPQVVLTHDPWKRYRLHPDHRAAGFLVCDAIVAARDPHFLPELGLAPHRPEVLLLWEADQIMHVEDITTSLPAKLDALGAHLSQYPSTMGVDPTDGPGAFEDFRARIEQRSRTLGERYDVEFAECFARIDDL